MSHSGVWDLGFGNQGFNQNHMLIWKPGLPKHNFQMAQVMQWPNAAICNYEEGEVEISTHVPPCNPGFQKAKRS